MEIACDKGYYNAQRYKEYKAEGRMSGGLGMRSPIELSILGHSVSHLRVFSSYMLGICGVMVAYGK